MTISSAINQFYTNLQKEIPPGTTPSIVSCLRALENLNLGKPDSTAIQKLATVVKAVTEPLLKIWTILHI